MHSRFIAALLAPALIVSGAAQGMLLRCGPEVRASCCCPGKKAPPPSPTMAAGAPQCCAVSVPPAPGQATHDRSAIAAPAPMLVGVAGEVTRLHAVFVAVLGVPRLDPPPGLSPVLVNCALLI